MLLVAGRYLSEFNGSRRLWYGHGLTGLSRTAASLELRKLVNDSSSGIIANGRGSQKLWLLGG